MSANSKVVDTEAAAARGTTWVVMYDVGDRENRLQAMPLKGLSTIWKCPECDREVVAGTGPPPVCVHDLSVSEAPLGP